MLRSVWLACLLWSSAGYGGAVDDHFANPFPGIEWGATLQRLQSRYANGISTGGLRGERGVAFVMPGDTELPGIDVAAQLVTFAFAQDGTLENVCFYFNYANRDVVLYKLAESLGHDYKATDTASGRTIWWKPGSKTRAQLTIGSSPNSWAYLQIYPVSSVSSGQQ